MLFRGFIGFFLGSIALLCSSTATSGRGDGHRGERRHSRRSPSNDCSHVATYFEDIDLGHAVPSVKQSDVNLEICTGAVTHQGAATGGAASHVTCCSRSAERKLHQMAMNDARDVIASFSSNLKTILSTRTQYQDAFLNVIQQASNSTKTMLTAVHTIPLHEVRGFVDNLFTDLAAYILRSNQVDIYESTDRFFDALFPVVFRYSLNDPTAVGQLSVDYRNCLKKVRHLVSPHPFGEIVESLADDLIGSFGIARVLLDAFDLAVETLNATDLLHFEHQCSHALTRLVHCAHCEGHVNVRPCTNFCLNVMRGCLVQVVDLDLHWNLFVIAVEQVVKGMRDTQDIQSVMTSFQTKVSDSMMNALYMAKKYHSQVIDQCGRLPTNPSSSAQSPNPPPPVNRNHRHHQTSSDHHQPEIRLHAKIEMFVRNLVDPRGGYSYSKLPSRVCSSENFSAGDYDTCWNGTALGEYTMPVVSSSITRPNSNPEMRISELKSQTIANLTDRLDQMTKLLHSRVMPIRKKPAGWETLNDVGDNQFTASGSESGDYSPGNGISGDDEYSGGGSADYSGNEPTEEIPASVRPTGVHVSRSSPPDIVFTELSSTKMPSPYRTTAPQKPINSSPVLVGSCYMRVAMLSILITRYFICFHRVIE